jgi:hypothetical protein
MAYNETARKRFRTASGVFPAISAGTITFTPPNVTGGTFVQDTFNIPGARTTDMIFVQPKNVATGLDIMSAEITAPSTLNVKLFNPTGITITGVSSQINYIVLRG